jgi:hypothetical protein
VIQLLQRIQHSIGEIDAIINGRKIPWDAEAGSDTDDSDDYLEADEGDPTELQQLTTSVAEVITNLMQLSSTIRNPAPHDRFKRSRNIDTSYYEPYDITHVKNKFPQADEFLVDRIGRAISHRRQYLQYRERHRSRLAEGLDAVDEITKGVEGTVASSIPAAMRSSSEGPTSNNDIEFDDHASQTSYASSKSGEGKLRPPPLPREGHDGTPFECPMCRYFVVIDQEVAWHTHVYNDLQPYVSSVT